MLFNAGERAQEINTKIESHSSPVRSQTDDEKVDGTAIVVAVYLRNEMLFVGQCLAAACGKLESKSGCWSGLEMRTLATLFASRGSDVGVVWQVVR